MTIHDVEIMLPNIVSLATLVFLTIVVLVFKQPLREVLGRVRHGKIAGIEIELDAMSSELAKLSVVQESTLPQIIHTLPAPSSDDQVDGAVDVDGFTTTLLDLAGRAPEAAVIALRVELRRRSEDLADLMNDSRIMRTFTSVTDEALVEKLKTAVTRSQSQTHRLLNIHKDLINLPSSNPKVRTTMFAYIDAGIDGLKIMTSLRNMIVHVSEVFTIENTVDSD